MKDWSPRDRALAEGLEILEATTSEHGHSVADIYNDDLDGWFEARPIINQEAAAIERWEKDNPKPELGVRLRVVDTRTERAAEGD
ncbi:hypothetical protein GCM10010401_07430 [Rarobacter faecitabidus]|uniref:hypothetical protein n=1 Tax=Rarobacter faecitabidus TaxID=13243 RepID=UPI0031E3EA5C